MRLLIISTFVLLLFSSPGRADFLDFIPRPFETGAEIRAFGSREFDENRISGKGFRWDDTFLREKFTLYSNGYIYHPLFLQYQASIGGSLKQEKFDSTFTQPTDWRDRSGVEYSGRLFVLPEHPYNAELFAFRLEPLFKEQAATQHQNVETSKGGFFRYRKSPYFLHGKYIDDDVTSFSNSSNIKTVGGGADFYKDFANGRIFSLSGSYNRPDFHSSNELNGTSNQYFASNEIRLKRISINSSFAKSNFNQTSRDRLFKSDSLSFFEFMTAYLPLRFRSDLQYRYQKDNNEFAQAESEPVEFSSIRKDLQAILYHRLYESLDTSYTFRWINNSSENSESENISHSLAANYTKSIPIGRLLAGVNATRSTSDNSGQTQVAAEQHSSIAVPGSFVLNQQTIDPDTIVIFVNDPLPPQENIVLTRDIHYTITAIGNTFQINIITLPERFIVPGTYDFRVSYSLIAGQFRLRTDTYSYNLTAQLFHNLLVPYFFRATSKYKLLSGVFPGFPLDSTTTTTGLTIYRGPFRLLGEYQKLDWEVSPYKSWKAEARYSNSLTETFRVYLVADYLNKYYPHGTFADDVSQRDERIGFSGSIQKRMFSGALVFSGGGSYSILRGLIEGNAYSLNSSLTWKVGRLDMTLGATAYQTDTESNNAATLFRKHQYYYLNVGRKLF